MPPKSTAKGKGKAKMSSSREAAEPNTTVPSNSSNATQLPSPVTSPRDTQAASTTPARPSHAATACASSSAPSTPKRKEQATISSFWPVKKAKIEIAKLPPTPEEKKAAREAKKAKDSAAKAARDAEKERQKELRKAEKREEEEDRLVLAAERQLKKQLSEAEERHKRDWADWVERNKRPKATFELPSDYKREMYRNVTECSIDFNLKRHEIDCLRHCDIDNPIRRDYAPMKLYRVQEVTMLAWKKAAILDGASQEDEARLLQAGKRLFEKSMKPKEKS